VAAQAVLDTISVRKVLVMAQFGLSAGNYDFRIYIFGFLAFALAGYNHRLPGKNDESNIFVLGSNPVELESQIWDLCFQPLFFREEIFDVGHFGMRKGERFNQYSFTSPDR
jgi:hypothetical protein